MGRYVSLPELKSYARNEIPTDDDSFLTLAIDAAEQTLDNACQRRFEVAGAASSRVFAANDVQVLRIDDCTTVTVVNNGGTILTASQYQLEPLNGRSAAGEPWPYEQIRLLSAGYWDDGTYTGEATVTITATWGWGAAVPSAIKQACLVLAKDICSNRDVRFGLVAVTEAAGIGARTNSIVRDAVAQYRRVEAWGIA